MGVIHRWAAEYKYSDPKNIENDKDNDIIKSIAVIRMNFSIKYKVTVQEWPL